VPLAVLLLTRPVRLFWHASGALCTVALLVYLASRTVGLPGSSDDIGNWWPTLGGLNVLVEAAVIAVAAIAVRPPRPAPGGLTSGATVASPDLEDATHRRGRALTAPAQRPSALSSSRSAAHNY
jgi:hypothetical protein